MENKQQPVVNICGSCILRDTFYYQGVYGKEKDGGYRINRYVNFFSPLALEQPPIPIYDRAAYEAFDLKPFGPNHSVTSTELLFWNFARTDSLL